MPEQLVSPGRIRREKQLFFLNNTQIPGIQSAQFQWENNIQPLKFIGHGNVPMVPQGEQRGRASINYLLIDKDNFLPFTGNSGFNGYVLQSRTNPSGNYSFTSGYLTSYSHSCRIGELPEAQVNIDVFGNEGRIPTGESAQTTGDFAAISTGVFNYNLKIPAPGQITLNLDEFQTNRVIGYSVSVNVNRKPVYALGSRFPVAVDIVYPIQVDCGFELEIGDDFSPQNMRKYPFQRKVENLSIAINQYDRSDSNILSFSFQNCALIGENYSIGTNGNARLAVSYRMFLTRYSGSFVAQV